MNEGPVLLLHWVEENIHPQHLTSPLLPKADFPSLQSDLIVIVKKFRKILFKELIFSKKQSASSMRQLVAISNTVHHYLYRLAPAWNQGEQAPHIRTFYICALNLLETLLEELGKLAPMAYKEIPVTQYRLPNLVMELKGKYRCFVLHLCQADIDRELKDLLLAGVEQLIRKKEISLLNADYCRQLMEVINGTSMLNTATLKNLLCLNGFNLPAFFFYCINGFKELLENIPGLHEQLDMLMNEQDKLSSLAQGNKIKMLPGVAPITVQLRGFLSEKKRHISQMLKLRRMIIQDDQKAKSMARLRINMPVAQFGLFIRVQIEKGLLLKENIGELFNFFALHFYTPQTLFISPENLRKKSTDAEFSTAQKLKTQLIGMLNWLNEHYNLSNYKGS